MSDLVLVSLSTIELRARGAVGSSGHQVAAWLLSKGTGTQRVTRLPIITSLHLKSISISELILCLRALLSRVIRLQKDLICFIMHLSALVAASLTLFASPAVAWGSIGHRTVGYLAEKYFNDDGRKFWSSLVQPNERFDISDASVWADTVRFRYPHTKDWHFIDAKDDPPRDCKVNYIRDCKRDRGCVVSALLNMVSRNMFLSDFYYDTSTEPTNRAVA